MLHVEILLDPAFAELAPDAALLVAAPGRLDVCGLHVIHPHDAGAQALHSAHRAEDVARPDGGREAVIRVVGDAQRVFLAVARDDGGDRTEDLLARDPIGVVDVVKDRRLQKVAAFEPRAPGPSAADGHFRFTLADLLVFAHAVELLTADERAHLRGAV